MAAYTRSRRVAVFCLMFAVFTILPSVNLGHGHSHDEHDHAGHGHAHDHHGHSHGDAPHHKYSQEANQPPAHEQHDHEHDHLGHDHHHGHDEDLKVAAQGTRRTQRDTGMTLWVKAVGSTLLISVAPVFILLVIPLDNTDDDSPLLKVLLSFASGGLLGDAFLHLIPHALSPHSHSGDEGHGHSHDHGHSHSAEGSHDHSADMRVGLWVLSGLIAFLMVEKFVKSMKGEDESGHGHNDGPKPVATKKEEDSKSDKSESLRKRKASDKGSSEISEDKNIEKHDDIKVAGYLNLAADFTHNFTDGLAIGASYLAGNSIGIITTLTVLIHEVPHEVGDFAILIKSGCSKKKAMMLQFSTALGAMAGTVVSLLAEGAGEAATVWILPFTAGGFIYIATVSVIPELLQEAKLWQTIKEIVAMIVGVLMMVLIAYVE